MTVQISDSVFHNKTRFKLAGRFGQGLFDPWSISFNLLPSNTACFRGYVADYCIIAGDLFLTSLQLSVAAQAPFGVGPVFFGARPKSASSFGLLYEDLCVPMPFTGRLLLTDVFTRDPWFRMGLHPPWKPDIVLEIIFAGGRIVTEHDHSLEIAVTRRKILEDAKKSGDVLPPLPQHIERWIAKSMFEDICSLLPRRPGKTNVTNSTHLSSGF